MGSNISETDSLGWDSVMIAIEKNDEQCLSLVLSHINEKVRSN